MGIFPDNEGLGCYQGKVPDNQWLCLLKAGVSNQHNQTFKRTATAAA